MKHTPDFFLELISDIDRQKYAPLTSLKNIESVLAEFVHEYEIYDEMIEDLIKWHYLKPL